MCAIHRRGVCLASLIKYADVSPVEESACDLPGLVMVATRSGLARLCQSFGASKPSVGACFRTGQVSHVPAPTTMLILLATCEP